MKKIVDFLNQPFPYFKKRWLVVVVTTIWIFSVFTFIKPFGLNSPKSLLWIISYFTIAALISSSLATYVFPLIFKKFYQPEKWTRGKYLLFSLIITMMMVLFSIIYFYILRDGFNAVSFAYKNYTIITGSIICASFPIIIIYLIETMLHEQEKWNDIKTSSATNQNNFLTGEVLTFSKNTREELKMEPASFIYAEVIRNNVIIFYKQNNSTLNKSLRTTLSQITEEVKDYPQIMRCHRAFIINTDNVTNIKGNSHGYQLTLKGIKNPIPVSRAYTKDVKNILKA